jgi:hypothetical protein
MKNSNKLYAIIVVFINFSINCNSESPIEKKMVLSEAATINQNCQSILDYLNSIEQNQSCIVFSNAIDSLKRKILDKKSSLFYFELFRLNFNENDKIEDISDSTTLFYRNGASMSLSDCGTLYNPLGLATRFDYTSIIPPRMSITFSKIKEFKMKQKSLLGSSLSFQVSRFKEKYSFNSRFYSGYLEIEEFQPLIMNYTDKSKYSINVHIFYFIEDDVDSFNRDLIKLFPQFKLDNE